MVAKGHYTGMAGVYYVAAELSSREFIVAVTSRNAPGIDIIATNKDGKRFDIQVKTNRGNPNFWLLSERAKEDKSPNLIYVFVNLKKTPKKDIATPDFYTVKSSDVVRNLAIDRSKSGSIWYSFHRRERDKDRWELLK